MVWEGKTTEMGHKKKRNAYKKGNCDGIIMWYIVYR